MGKISTSETRKVRHDPLYKTISTLGGNLRNKTSKREQKEEVDEEFIDAASSRKILQLAREQQAELEEEEDNYVQDGISMEESDEENSSEEVEYSDYEVEEEEYFEGDEDDENIDPEQAAMFEAYFKSQSSNPFGSFNLADKVMAKIQEKEAQKSNPSSVSQQRPEEGVMLPPKVIAVFTKVGETLKFYRHGKLPKLFKLIPTLRNWKDVLFVTDPESWSNQAVYEATKLFVSNLKPKDAQYFIEVVLLQKFRDNIENDEQHRLNYHIHRSLKKSLYKPSAFFRGFLYPLVQEGCTTREAVIAASVLLKNSIPALHSSAALDWLLDQDYKPATTVFIRVLLEKKYALPFQVIDNVVAYFIRFRNLTLTNLKLDDDAKLPLVWQKLFLAFAQRYKNDITEDQRDFLIETVRQRGHKDIGPEITRELLAGENRLPPSERKARDEVMLDLF